MDYTLNYREVIPDQTLPDKWKEIILNTGGSQSALQDIKVPERAGGYCYKDSSKYFTRNRFICWRIIHDVLELVEYSLDVNLVNNRVRYKFTDTPLLDGISIYETANSVVILIVTVSSIHRFSFLHLDKIYKQEQIYVANLDLTMQSIFSEATIQISRDSHTYVIPTAGVTNSPVPHAAVSLLTVPQEEALFAFAYSSGTILLLRWDAATGLVHSSELKQESIMPRFLSGLATALRGRLTENEVSMSLAMHSCNSDVYLFALYREGHLRMWSCKKIQCIAEIDIFVNKHNNSQIIQNHGLRKMVSSNNELYLCTFLKFENKCEFCILKVVDDLGILKFNRVCTLPAPNQHLVDFSLTSTRLWAVWRTTDIDSINVTHAQLSLNNTQLYSEWESAVLAQSTDKDYIINDSSTDPRQAYINHIFNNGQFSLIDINRALNIYRRSNFVNDINLSSPELKERVCMAVEAEIQTEVMEYEVTDEDYLEIVNRCWSKFYSCVQQYHLNGSRPLGLLLLPNVYGVILLKKSSFSILRPIEALEHLMLCNERSSIARFKATPILSQDHNVFQDLVCLVSALVMLEEQLSDDIKYSFAKELYHLKGPDLVVQNFLNKLILETDEFFSDFDFKSELYHKLASIKDISSAIAMLLEALTYDFGQPRKLDFSQKQLKDDNEITDINYFFGSQLGVSAISKSLSQIIALRFCMCQNLLFLQQFALSQPEMFDSQSLHAINSSLAPRTVVLTQAYYVVMWICESNTSITPSQALLETSIQRLSLLKLYDTKSIIGKQQKSFSLLESFIRYGAKKHMYKLLDVMALDVMALDSSTSIIWHLGMLSHITLVAQLVWPISGNFFFPEWLLSSCQFLLVQEYVRLLNTWCEWNGASRKFILAVSFLEMGEPQKACDHFLRASTGVITDSYMIDLLLNSKTLSESNAMVHYYLKVIELFEQHNVSDCIVELAMTAITVAEKDDPNLATLHSIVFSQHLSLQHHIEAYNCLNTNPDVARRTDCLRQLVVTLFDRKKLIDLISFPYVDMYQDLEKIMEARARSVDLMENNYYDFLYSFHINKGNVRKAASIMYEQALRLTQEPQTFPIISRHTFCLLSCINTLNLVHEKYRWIVRPVLEQTSFEEDSDSGKKRSLSGDEIIQYKVKKRIEVLELEDIKQEYVLSEAKLKLVKLHPDMYVAAQTVPLEVVALMSSVGLYVDALYVCDFFNLSKSLVLENLTSQCINLSHKDDPKAWNCLNYNDVLDLSGSTSSISNVFWRLLEYLVQKHEKDGQTELHKTVARKLFHRGAFLPEWLRLSYMKRNAAELLRLMIQMGRLEEAGYLALRYIKAILGKDQEDFGLEAPLSAVTAPVYLPYNTIEILLLELKYASEEDQSYTKIYKLLDDKLNNYLKTVERVSENIIQLRRE